MTTTTDAPTLDGAKLRTSFLTVDHYVRGMTQAKLRDVMLKLYQGHASLVLEAIQDVTHDEVLTPEATADVELYHEVWAQRLEGASLKDPANADGLDEADKRRRLGQWLAADKLADASDRFRAYARGQARVWWKTLVPVETLPVRASVSGERERVESAMHHYRTSDLGTAQPSAWASREEHAGDERYVILRDGDGRDLAWYHVDGSDVELAICDEQPADPGES